MDPLRSVLSRLRDLLEAPLLTLGGTALTVWALVSFVVLVVLLLYLSRALGHWISHRVLARGGVAEATRHTVGTLVRYTVLLVGLLVIFQTVGINLTAFTVLAGALGIGVGFGLQNVVNNFISGLIILFERPIKVGDRIEVGNVLGDVVRIGARSTTVVTNDNIAIIVPNSKFIAENVVNWSFTEDNVRLHIPVTVAYGSDLRLVERLLLEAAVESPDVLPSPPPGVRFLEFGDSGLKFELRAWTSTLMHRQGRFVSALNFAIYEKFRAHGVEIPYTQLDVHIRPGPAGGTPTPADS